MRDCACGHMESRHEAGGCLGHYVACECRAFRAAAASPTVPAPGERYGDYAARMEASAGLGWDPFTTIVEGDFNGPHGPVPGAPKESARDVRARHGFAPLTAEQEEENLRANLEQVRREERARARDLVEELLAEAMAHATMCAEATCGHRTCDRRRELYAEAGAYLRRADSEKQQTEE